MKEYHGIKYYDNKDGYCPICNSKIHYTPGDNMGDGLVYYSWFCNHCWTRGEAWFKQTFEGHTIITKEAEEEIELPL